MKESLQRVTIDRAGSVKFTDHDALAPIRLTYVNLYLYLDCTHVQEATQHSLQAIEKPKNICYGNSSHCLSPGSAHGARRARRAWRGPCLAHAAHRAAHYSRRPLEPLELGCGCGTGRHTARTEFGAALGERPEFSARALGCLERLGGGER